MAIKNKAALQAEIATLFADNIEGDITAAVLRSYLLDILDSKLLQVISYVLLDPAPTPNDPSIDENILYIAGSEATVDLPPAAGLEGRQTRFITTTTDKLSFIPDGSDVIVGNQSVSQPSQVQVACTGANEWTVLVLPLQNIVALANLGNGFIINQVDPDNPVIDPDWGFATDAGTNDDVPDSWTTIAELNTVPTKVGAWYMITVSAVYNLNATNRSAGFRLTGDIVTQEFMQEPKDASDLIPLSYSIPYQATDVTTSIDVEFKKETSGNTMDVSYCTITMQRIG